MDKTALIIAKELKLRPEQAQAALELLDAGNTIPFIARYRKEATGSMDEEQLRQLDERAQYLRNLDARREEIIASIEAQEKMTDDLRRQIEAAQKLQDLEDLYLPYRPKKRTRAMIAREKGLEPLANRIMLQAEPKGTMEEEAAPFIDPEKGVETAEDAIKGALDIVAETVSDRADVRKFVRSHIVKAGDITSSLTEEGEKGGEFANYAEYKEPVHLIPPHRILALNRGEKLKALKVSVDYPAEKMLADLDKFLGIRAFGKTGPLYAEAAADAYKRLIFPSIEREIRNELTETAEKQAIRVFGVNLRALLLQQPIAGHTVIGLDPGYRTGCKTAVIDPQGQVLATEVLYITGSKHQEEEAERKFLALVKKYGATLVSIGNGTASYETEEFTARMISEHHLNLRYLITSEAGASVYSASTLARDELPELDVSLRGAVSIARRVQDPMAELVKIDPKAIGVGQYQHDINQKELGATLADVVESCVNHVGVELNTASAALLGYVAGISSTVAKNIVAWRNENGRFKNRKELLKVPRLGPAAFTQCAGFLRLKDADNPLDNTSVHPESYPLAENILKLLGFALDSCSSPAAQLAAARTDPAPVAEKLGAGLPTVTDILKALAKPGRDPREDSPAPVSRQHVSKLSDLAIGSIVKGTVRNVVDFGCFVDIGLKTDGLVHRSELSDQRFKHPLDVVTPGDIIDVMIISIDEKRNRIGLSLKKARKKDAEQH